VRRIEGWTRVSQEIPPLSVPWCDLGFPVLCVIRGPRNLHLYVPAHVARISHILREAAVDHPETVEELYTRQPAAFYLAVAATLLRAGVRVEVLAFAEDVPGAVAAIWRAHDPASWAQVMGVARGLE